MLSRLDYLDYEVEVKVSVEEAVEHGAVHQVVRVGSEPFDHILVLVQAVGTEVLVAHVQPRIGVCLGSVVDVQYVRVRTGWRVLPLP